MCLRIGIATGICRANAQLVFVLVPLLSFFGSVVPPVGGALSLLKMHSVVVRPCS